MTILLIDRIGTELLTINRRNFNEFPTKSEHILFLVIRNACKISLQKQVYELQTGDFLLIPANTNFRITIPSIKNETGTNELFFAIVYSLDFLSSFTAPYDQDWVAYFTDSDAKLLRTSQATWLPFISICETILTEIDLHRPGYEQIVRGYIMMFSVHILRTDLNYNHKKSKSTEKFILYQTIAIYIFEHYDENINTKILAEKFYLSEITLNRLFTKHYGSTVHQYINQRRMIVAKDLLVDGVSPQNCALLVGYQDYSTFFRQFKHHFKLNPSEFLNQFDHR